MGGHSPTIMTAAARRADIWSAYATTSSLPDAFAPMTEELDRICASIGRDPGSIAAVYDALTGASPAVAGSAWHARLLLLRPASACRTDVIEGLRDDLPLAVDA